jgi:hypothetical protein
MHAVCRFFGIGLLLDTTNSRKYPAALFRLHLNESILDYAVIYVKSFLIKNKDSFLFSCVYCMHLTESLLRIHCLYDKVPSGEKKKRNADSYLHTQ